MRQATPATPMPTSEIVKVPFRGDEILTVDVDGKPHIVLKPALESIGIDYSTQLIKLKRRSWATMGQCPTVAEDGKNREMTTVDVRTFLMLLATVDEARVAAHVKDKLIAYQSEVADAIEEYWTRGGAINPRATADQLTEIITRAEGQARVLRALDGIVDPAWLDAKGRHIAARALGEEPEIDPATRPLTVGEYLEGHGIKGAVLRSMSTTFGRDLKAAFRERYRAEPPTVQRFVSGALRSVAAYNEAHRDLFDEVYRAWATARVGASR